MERIEIPEIKFNNGNSTTNINIVFSNLVFRGAENFQLKDVQFDVDKTIFQIALMVPEFYMTADYATNGRIILLEFNGHGVSKFNFSKW